MYEQEKTKFEVQHVLFILTLKINIPIDFENSSEYSILPFVGPDVSKFPLL
jgi:hypothetical protein